MEFADLPLHDATLSAIHISYEAGRCDLVLRVLGGGIYQLAFEGFRTLDFPRHQPWGRSCSVNVARQIAAQRYEFELQSGDVLRVEATSWSLLIPR